MKIQTLPARERPRERCLEHGPDTLSLRECLALILGSGPRDLGCLWLADRILSIPGEGLPEREQERAFFTMMETGGGLLNTMHGLGPAGRARLLTTFELARRYNAFRTPKPPQFRMIASVSATPQFGLIARSALAKISRELRAAPQEWLGFVALHRGGELGDFCVVEKGARTHVNTDPAELFARLLAVRPRGFFLFHNHPSGDTTPSSHDRSLTTETSRLGREFGIRLLGHWIVGYDSEVLIH